MNTEEIIASVGFKTIGSRIRRQRQNQGLSVRDLAEKAEVNKNSILRLEKGLGFRAATLENICRALSLHLDGLVIGDETVNQTAAIQREEPKVWHDLKSVVSGPLDGLGDASKIPIQLLSSRLPNGRVIPTIIVVNQPTPPGSHRGEEFVYVLEGRLRLSIGEQTYSVGPSESITFWSGEQHSYAPDGCLQATILSVRVDY